MNLNGILIAGYCSTLALRLLAEKQDTGYGYKDTIGSHNSNFLRLFGAVYVCNQSLNHDNSSLMKLGLFATSFAIASVNYSGVWNFSLSENFDKIKKREFSCVFNKLSFMSSQVIGAVSMIVAAKSCFQR